MNLPNQLSMNVPLVDPGYISERALDPLTSPTIAPRFVRDGERDHWWLQGSALEEAASRSTTIDMIDSGLRN